MLTFDKFTNLYVSNYSQHVKGGWISHFGLSMLLVPWLLYFGSSLGLVLSIIGLSVPITLFASILPDIDHQYSRTNTLFRYALFVITTTITVATLVNYKSNLNSILSQYDIAFIDVPIIIIVSITIGCLILILFKRIRPNHRGLTHSIVFLSITTILVSLLLWHTAIIFSVHTREIYTVLPLYYMSGMLTHLYLDGEIP